MILAEKYLARHETPFAAYMALQRALLLHYMSRGGTEERWCERIAPIFQRRYSPAFALTTTLVEAPTAAGPRDLLKN